MNGSTDFVEIHMFHRTYMPQYLFNSVDFLHRKIFSIFSVKNLNFYNSFMFLCLNSWWMGLLFSWIVASTCLFHWSMADQLSYCDISRLRILHSLLGHSVTNSRELNQVLVIPWTILIIFILLINIHKAQVFQMFQFFLFIINPYV
jgi:hypothetical protein